MFGSMFADDDDMGDKMPTNEDMDKDWDNLMSKLTREGNPHSAGAMSPEGMRKHLKKNIDDRFLEGDNDLV